MSEKTKEKETRKMSVTVVKNGYLVDGILAGSTRLNQSLVFESFQKLTEWMEKNLKEIEGANK